MSTQAVQTQHRFGCVGELCGVGHDPGVKGVVVGSCLFQEAVYDGQSLLGALEFGFLMFDKGIAAVVYLVTPRTVGTGRQYKKRGKE